MAFWIRVCLLSLLQSTLGWDDCQHVTRKRDVGFSFPQPRGSHQLPVLPPPNAFDSFLARVDPLFALFVLKIHTMKVVKKKRELLSSCR